MRINRDRSLTDVALTITHLLEKNLVITYDAEENPFWELYIYTRLKRQKGDGYDGGAEGVFGAGDGR